MHRLFTAGVLWGIVGCGLCACKARPLPQGLVPPEGASISRDFDRESLALGPNDVVRVHVFGHPELSTPETGARLDFEGNLSLPLIGFVSLEGLKPQEAAARLHGRFAEFVKEPDVTLSVVEFSSRRFYVFGEVANPGAYVLDRPINALAAITLAGGPDDGADRENVCLLRQVDEFVAVHLFNVATPDSEGLVAVQPGDFIFVRQSGSGRFREQVLPVLQGIAPTMTSLVNLGLVAATIND